MAFAEPLTLPQQVRGEHSRHICSRTVVRLRHRSRQSARYHRPSFPVSCKDAAALPASVATTTDKATSSTVHIVGCVHGSHVSAADVRTLMDTTQPDAVVLELCPARLVAVRGAVKRMPEGGRVSDALNKNRRVRSFAEARQAFNGTPQAILATILESVYSLQTLSGLDPGVEFAHPIRTMELNRIVCGDAPASETVQRLYHAFASPLKSIAVAREALGGLFRRLIVPPTGGVSIPSLILMDRARVLEILRLLVPTTLFAFSVTLVGSTIVGFLSHAVETTSVVSTLAAQSTTVSSGDAWGVLSILAQVCFFGYFGISILHFLKVLVADRDVVIAKSIMDSTGYYSLKQERPVTLVVVVGLLHVNGILRCLQDSQHLETS